MTTQQARAVQIAKRDALCVVGHGTRKRDGVQVFAVPSRSEANRLHVVAVLSDRLECDCLASQNGRVCAHRACVHDYLLAGLRAAIRQQATAQLARAIERETAPRVVSNAPVTIWK
jgi:hypothetical protein